MKFLTAFIAALLILLTSVPPVSAQSSPSAPEIHGEAAYLIDVQSGQTLFQKNGDKRLPPASTTKIMTGLLAIEKGNLDDKVTLSPTMLDYQIVYGTRIYLEPGEQMSLRDLLYALLLNSANDAAVGIAEYIGGNLPQFVAMMNDKAKALGMTNTTFKNPSGLTEEGHLTTAHDLARLAMAAYANPTFREYTQTKRHTISRSKPNLPSEMINENRLLGQDPYVNGMKTGYTVAAKNCLVASASKDGHDLIAVILKSPGGEIYTDMKDLLNYGFSQFQTSVYKPAGTSLTQTSIGNDPINLLLSKDIYITHKVNEPSIAPTLKIRLPNTPIAEVEKGQAIGAVEVWNGDEKTAEIPLLSDRSVHPKASLAKRSHPWLVLGLITILLAGIFIRWLITTKTFSSKAEDK